MFIGGGPGRAQGHCRDRKPPCFCLLSERPKRQLAAGVVSARTGLFNGREPPLRCRRHVAGSNAAFHPNWSDVNDSTNI